MCPQHCTAIVITKIYPLYWKIDNSNSRRRGAQNDRGNLIVYIKRNRLDFRPSFFFRNQYPLPLNCLRTRLFMSMAHACLVREHVVLLFRRLNESRELDTRWGGEGRVADGGGEKQIAKKCSDFTFLCRGIFHLRQFGRRMTLRRAAFGRSSIKSEILFLGTVPACYYLLAVFQKKHRRRRCHARDRAAALNFGRPRMMRYTLGTHHRSMLLLLASRSIENKKRRETINSDKNDASLCA